MAEQQGRTPDLPFSRRDAVACPKWHAMLRSLQRAQGPGRPGRASQHLQLGRRADRDFGSCPLPEQRTLRFRHGSHVRKSLYPLAAAAFSMAWKFSQQVCRGAEGGFGDRGARPAASYEVARSRTFHVWLFNFVERKVGRRFGLAWPRRVGRLASSWAVIGAIMARWCFSFRNGRLMAGYFGNVWIPKMTLGSSLTSLT
jgi:hypothetical protein